MTDILLLVTGLVLLLLGGELLVRGAVAIAERLGMSPLLIGLTLVGFGTSAPELVTSVQAALADAPGIAVGNVVGSNISNILLILGVSALIAPIRVGSSALARDGVVMVIVCLAFAILGFGWTLDRLAGLLFVSGLAAYVALAYRQERVPGARHGAAFEKAEAYEEVHDGPLRHARTAPTRAEPQPYVAASMAVGGLAIVVIGGHLLVEGAVGIARSRGIPETLIGLTIVAVGTSMPEFVTSVVAAVRRHSDVALGNVLGSSIYNILGIAGVTGLISPTTIPPAIVAFDNLVMVAASVALLLFAATGRRIGRLEGGLLLAGYAAYLLALRPT
ncbi:MAG: calcium/sodium antiporter [Vicinamibacterales bacterium]